MREVCEFIWYMSSIKGTSTVIYLFTVSTQGVQNVVVVVVVHMYVVCVHPVVQNKTG